MTPKISLPLLAVTGLAALSVGCTGNNLCDRSSRSASGKTSSCGGQTFDALGPRCSAAEASCPDGDAKILEEMVACFEALPTCSPTDEQGWVSQRAGCYANAEGLSEGCRGALFEGGVIPGVDAGVEDLDAGPQPDLDGGGALDLFAAADENNIALAWTRRQSGFVNTWNIHSKSGADVPYPSVAIKDLNASFYTYSGVGPNHSRDFFVMGTHADGGVVMGVPFGGFQDAGAAGCTMNTECPVNRVCEVRDGGCRPQPCSNNAQCPNGYVCDQVNTNLCLRNSGDDAGTVVGGSDAGAGGPKPMLSELLRAATLDSATSPLTVSERSVSEFPADQDPDVVGIDSARQAVTIQQFGQIWLHTTEDRGRTFRALAIDPIGVNPRLTYNKTSRQLFVCYQAGRAVRVRTSLDFGKTFSPTIAEIALPDPGDGGLSQPVTDCDVAPWRDGGVIVSVLEFDRVVTYVVSSGLAIGTRDEAFINEPNDGGTQVVFNVQQPTLATLPDEFIVHVAFQGTRNIVSGTTTTTDKDVYGVYRDPARTAGLFTSRMRISGGAPGSQGQVLEQGRPTLALEPATGRAAAAFQSEEATGTGGTYQSVYLALFDKFGTSTTFTWATGGDLSVFARASSTSTYVVMTDRPPSGPNWDAVSPSLAFTGNGKGYLAFGAGLSSSPASPYVVGFSFDANNPIANVKGWYLPPAVKVSTTPLVNLGNTPKRTGPVISADQQISAYLIFIEGVGAGAGIPNRPIVLNRPQ